MKEPKGKRYCMDCLRWYFDHADQCHVPACGLLPDSSSRVSGNSDARFGKAVGHIRHSQSDPVGATFLKDRLKYIHFIDWRLNRVYGTPSEMNTLNDCYFHIAIPRVFRVSYIRGIVRFFIQCPLWWR